MQMPEDNHATARHPVTESVRKPPTSGAVRQKTYRRSRAGKSVDVAGATHALLAQLCRLEGTSIDATLRSVLTRALEERNDRDLLEAAWAYLNSSRALFAEFEDTDSVTERLATRLADTRHAFNEVLSRGGEVLLQTQRRVNWLAEQGTARVEKVVANSVVVEPLAADARHGTLSDTAQTLMAGGESCGRSLNSASLVFMAVADNEPGGRIVRVRAGDHSPQ
jgi:hypothetical protein